VVGSRHTRRLAALVLAGVFIFGASGCYVGNSTTSDVRGFWELSCPSGVDLGPGKITGGGDTTSSFGLWQAAPTAVSVQFAVMSSDSTNPITADPEYAPGLPTPSLGVVWDGTRSTGVKSFPMIPTPTGALPFFVQAYALPYTPLFAHMRWWMRALDAAGKDVGFVDCLPFQTF